MRKLSLLTLLMLSGCAALMQGFGFSFQIGGNPPNAAEARIWRAQNQRVLINGNPVNTKDYPAVVRVMMDNGSCTGTIIGPKVLLTAAHCAASGNKVAFKTFDGKSYTAVMTNGSGYPTQDLDLNLGLINQVVSVPPASIRIDKFERTNMEVEMVGFGCINPGGGGGNDGILRKGSNIISAGQGFDLVLNAPNKSALCFGDSGGPLFYQGQVIAVNSKGNIQDTSYCTRTTLPESAAFIKQWAVDNNTQICGVNVDCGNSHPPTPPPVPKSFSFEDANVKISGYCK